MAAEITFWTTDQAILALALVDAVNTALGLDPEKDVSDPRFLAPFEMGWKNYARVLVFTCAQILPQHATTVSNMGLAGIGITLHDRKELIEPKLDKLVKFRDRSFAAGTDVSARLYDKVVAEAARSFGNKVDTGEAREMRRERRRRFVQRSTLSVKEQMLGK